MALAINTSREDRQMLRMLASRIAPRQRNVPVKMGSLPIGTLEDLDQASTAILKKALSGVISWSEAAEACAVIETRRSVLVSQTLERRVRVLENADRDSEGLPQNQDDQRGLASANDTKDLE
jgi:hypothetical protein